MPRFSVIIPLYNKENFVAATIDSVLAQSFSDFELIVVDDGSSDNSGQIVQSYTDKRITYIRTENRGVSSARNLGIEKASADYITFLDADDLWKPDFLQEMHDAINQFPDHQVFAAAIEKSNGRRTFPARYSINYTGKYQSVEYFSASMKETAICTSCAVFHKSVFEKIGNFEVSLPSGQDTDLWIRIGLVYPVLFVDKILATYVFDAVSLSKNKNHLLRKSDFSHFSEQEKLHPGLKKFLDYNRYSLAIRSKAAGLTENSRKLAEEINPSNLTSKQRFLLKLPSFLLRILFRLKNRI